MHFEFLEFHFCRGSVLHPDTTRERWLMAHWPAPCKVSKQPPLSVGHSNSVGALSRNGVGLGKKYIFLMTKSRFPFSFSSGRSVILSGRPVSCRRQRFNNILLSKPKWSNFFKMLILCDFSLIFHFYFQIKIKIDRSFTFGCLFPCSKTFCLSQ